MLIIPAAQVGLPIDNPLALASVVLMLALLGGALLVIRALWVRTDRLNEELRNQSLRRGKAEDAWLASEAFYHSLVENLPQNIFRKDAQGRFTFANRRFCTSLERPLEEILGRTDYDFYPESLAEKYRRDDLRVMQSGEALEDVEAHVNHDGEVRRVQVTKSPLRDPTGRVVGLQCIFWDVTEQYRTLEALAASEERFALAVRGTNDGLWDWNVRTNDTYYSPRFKELLGYGEDEFPGRIETFMDHLHPEDRPRVEAVGQRHLHDQEPYVVEYRLRDKAGQFHWFLARGQAVWDESGQPVRMAGSISDIHDRKMAEELLRAQNQLLQDMAKSERRALEEREQAQSRMVESAKLAGLGQLVAGVAHEINNPLAFVGNNVAVLQRDLVELHNLIRLYRRGDASLAESEPDLAEEVRNYCDEIDIDYTLENLRGLLDRTRDGLRRIHDIVKDLRVFARLDEGDLAEVDLNSGIESSVNIILGYAKKRQVEVVCELGTLPPVSCHAAKINQVLMNLIVNGIDACETNGRVLIRSRSCPGEEGVCVEVRDDGCGIDAKIRDRIFDPFFTTKPVGIGTGLGLSISYGIVLDHGGTIEVDSLPGEGSCFIVRLPLRPPARSPHRAVQEVV
ncbi:PAS domain-containing sensor histidine kinase [Tautonia plasticadhaerens]|uniref:histidine kinase n=1 Tax=Tautonia plasticadhaerens TaxID=2527974 RepID=A0A518H8V0_9BACT|nr:PAS domain S-box protein [Tautonia plasticadhaerens]QDV37269.1 Sensor protein ZraS [Tautonia plasticadhaerens]